MLVGPAPPPASTIVTIFWSRVEVTPASYYSPIVAAAEPTCSLSLQSSSYLRSLLTLTPTGILPSLGWPRRILLVNDLQFEATLLHAVYKLLGVLNNATSLYHLNSNGGVQRVNDTMAQMLAMVVNEFQINSYKRLLHVELRTPIRSALKSVYLRTRSIWTSFHASFTRVSNAPGSPAKRAWNVSTLPTATRRSTTSTRTIASANTVPLQFLARNAATQHLARF